MRNYLYYQLDPLLHICRSGLTIPYICPRKTKSKCLEASLDHRELLASPRQEHLVCAFRVSLDGSPISPICIISYTQVIATLLVVVFKGVNK